MSVVNSRKDHRKPSWLKQYRPGTFDKRVAYGQRQRKLALVSSGILYGFKVRCETDKEAANLARALRLRVPKVERSERARYSVRVQVKEKTIYVTRKGFLHR